MKTPTLSLSMLAFLAITACQPAQQIDIEQEKDAIKAVLEEETEAFFDGDMERLAATHVRDETNIRMTATRLGYTYHEGWDEVRAFFQDYFDNELEPGDFYEVKKNYKIKVYGDAAWAVYDNEYYNEDDELLSTSIHAQFLEKVNGQWKLVFYNSIYDSTWGDTPDN